MVAVLKPGSNGESVRDLQQAMNAVGFPVSVDGDYGPQTTRAVRGLQFGYAFPDGLVRDLDVDGIYGPASSIALQHSLDRDGRCSEHFWFDEFRSKGNGEILIHRDAVRWCEVLRQVGGRGFTPISSYRDPAHNRAVGGASNSTHMRGLAVDPGFRVIKVTGRQLLEHGFHGGLGTMDQQAFIRPSHAWQDGWVAHLDVRYVDGDSNSWWRYDGLVSTGYRSGFFGQTHQLSNLAKSFGLTG